MWTTLALAACLAAPGHVYYLAPTGHDGGPGTREQPWQTLAKANATVQPGDTVVLGAGRYQGLIEPVAGGEPGRPITWRAEPALGAVITGGPSAGGPVTCVRLVKKSWLRLADLALEPERGGGMQLQGVERSRFSGLRLTRSDGVYAPVDCRDCHHNQFVDIVCDRAVLAGADGHIATDMWSNYHCTHTVFDRCVFRRAGHHPFQMWFDSDHNVVRRCVFDGRWGRDFEFFSTPRVLIEQCVITNSADSSGSADGRAKLFTIDGIFRRNVIYRNWSGPLVINSYQYEQLPIFEMAGTRLYQNTWYRNYEYGFEMIDLNQHPEPHHVRDNVFANNLFADNDPGGDGLALLLYRNIADDNRFLNNLLWAGRLGAKTVYYDFTFPGLKAWPGQRYSAPEANQALPGQFAANLEADPRLTAPRRDDFRLRPDSPCRDAGRPLAATTAAGRGAELPVDDARWFYDGFGIDGEQGDLIWVGQAKAEARVKQADLARRVLLLDRPLTWATGDPVTLPFAGQAPDLGAPRRCHSIRN